MNNLAETCKKWKKKSVLEALFIFASVNPNQTNTQTSTCSIHLPDISFDTIALNKIYETFLKFRVKLLFYLKN